jgi:putative transcriptional regulator
MDIKRIDIEKVARAIEADAGMELAGLRESLGQAKRGEFSRVTTPEQLLVRSARAKTGLTQQVFAKRIATPVATLRDWEQGRFVPPGGVVCLLRLIDRHPDLSEELAA